jgi:TolB-like protein
MAAELRSIGGGSGDDTPVLARTLTRIVVLPFRVLRPDPEIDFLAFSLPDAIATSLSSNRSLVVRSSATAARFGGEAPDLKALAAEVDVDRVVMGTLLRAGDQLRVAVQVVETPGGTIVSSHTVQASLVDLFRLQDDVARGVAAELGAPTDRAPSGIDSTPTPYAPQRNSYEMYLRANELARNYAHLVQARDLYERCLELDPGFAQAWAQLGRCHRVIGKYIEGSPDSEARAEEAFRRALSLNPRLTVAHKYYAQLEADMGRAETALVRLLGEAARHGNDPELFAGIVHAARYCGLYDEAIAAHEEARRLDPNVPTSIEQTVLMTGDVERLLSIAPPPLITGGDDGIRVIGLGLAGRRDEARKGLTAMREHAVGIPAFDSWVDYLMAWLDRRAQDMPLGIADLKGLKIMDDPEAIFQEGWLLCDAGAHELGLGPLRRGVEKGYFAAPALEERPQFDALRGQPAFEELLTQARAGRDRALAAFRAAGGERLVGRAA